MLKMTACLIILSTLFSPAITPEITMAQTNPSIDVPTFCDSANRFALALYPQTGPEDQNLIFSPYSIDTALLMTYAGARGNTATEIAAALQLPAQAGDPHAAAGELIAKFQTAPGDNGAIIRVADALWGQNGVSWSDDFLNLLQKTYLAKLANLDFAQSDAARKTINDWIADQTNDKIKDLIPSGLLNALTKMVLTNAIYFKADWDSPFEKDSTHNADFHLDRKSGIIQTPTMHRAGRVSFFQDPQLAAIQMTYKSSDLAMLILLPNRNDGLPGLERNLDITQLSQVITGLTFQPVAISLPQFKITASFDASAALKSLGIKAAFTDKADFSGMDGKHDLYLSAVVHQAYVAVDENGTEAAAATAMVFRATAIQMPPPVTFNADHPFLFLIRDTKTGMILFMGRVQNPAE
jgi:serpin B